MLSSRTIAERDRFSHWVGLYQVNTAVEHAAGSLGLGHGKRTLPAERCFTQVLPDKWREVVHPEQCEWVNEASLRDFPIVDAERWFSPQVQLEDAHAIASAVPIHNHVLGKHEVIGADSEAKFLD